jgi:hypothetical protein
MIQLDSLYRILQIGVPKKSIIDYVIPFPINLIELNIPTLIFELQFGQ